MRRIAAAVIFMISGEHTCIRTADADDAPGLHAIFAGRVARAALLDSRREPLHPSRAELAELLSKREPSAAFYAVEDRAGEIIGMCSLRGLNREQAFAEVIALFTDEARYRGPEGDEAVRFLLSQGFGRYRLDKVVAHCLDSETTLREYWTRHGFTCDGVQREVLWTRGRWHDLVVMTRHAA